MEVGGLWAAHLPNTCAGPKGHLPEVGRRKPEHSPGHWLKKKMARKMREQTMRKKKEEQVPLKVT